MTNLSYHSTDMDMTVKIECKQVDALSGYPDQGDLREAINKLLNALHGWDEVEISISKTGAFCKESDL